MNQMNLLKTRKKVLGFNVGQESELRLVMNKVEDCAPEILAMKGFNIYGNTLYSYGSRLISKRLY